MMGAGEEAKDRTGVVPGEAVVLLEKSVMWSESREAAEMDNCRDTDGAMMRRLRHDANCRLVI